MKLNLHAPCNQLGYGIAGSNIALALNNLGIEVSLFPIGPRELPNEQDFIPMLQRAQYFDRNAPCLRIYHQHSMAERVGRGKLIGFPIFELDTFTPVEKHHLSSVDRLFVTCDWAKAVVYSNLVPKQYDEHLKDLTDNISVVPLGVDNTLFFPSPLNSGPTLFFNIGKWEQRKSHDILIKAFKGEFGSDGSARLFLCTENPFLSREQRVKWEKQLDGAGNIHYISRRSSQNEIADLIRQCDCGVFPSRAEGWNLEALETLSCGRHLIVTDYSAHKAYATTDNAKLINITKLEPAYDNIWPVFYGQGNWAKFEQEQITQLQQHMRAIHNLKQSSQLKINDAGIETVKKFTWENTAKTIVENLS